MSNIEKIIFIGDKAQSSLNETDLAQHLSLPVHWIDLTQIDQNQSKHLNTHDIFIFSENSLLTKSLLSQVNESRTIICTNKPLAHSFEQFPYNTTASTPHLLGLGSDKQWNNNYLTSTCSKLISKDILGIEAYTGKKGSIVNTHLSTTHERKKIIQKLIEFAQDHSLGSHFARAIASIAEELLMNAIYDAPSLANPQNPTYKQRSEDHPIAESERPKLSFGVAGDLFVLGCLDPFGLMNKEKLFSYAKKICHRNNSEQIIDQKELGAGLGIFKMIYSATALICNVEPSTTTEFICLFDTRMSTQDIDFRPRSISFFSNEC